MKYLTYFLHILEYAFKPVFWCYHKMTGTRRRLHRRAGGSSSVVERPSEYGFVLQHLPTGDNIRVLDVGTGSTAFGALLIDSNYTVDCLENTSYRRGVLPMNPHCNLMRGDITRAAPRSGYYDAVTCISVLEHIPAFDMAVENMIRALKPGGALIMTFPYCDDRFVKDSYTHPDSNRFKRPCSYICNVYSRAEIDAWCRTSGAVLESQWFNHFWSGPFWNSGDVLPDGGHRVSGDEKHDHSCIVIRKPRDS